MAQIILNRQTFLTCDVHKRVRATYGVRVGIYVLNMCDGCKKRARKYRPHARIFRLDTTNH